MLIVRIHQIVEIIIVIVVSHNKCRIAISIGRGGRTLMYAMRLQLMIDQIVFGF